MHIHWHIGIIVVLATVLAVLISRSIRSYSTQEANLEDMKKTLFESLAINANLLQDELQVELDRRGLFMMRAKDPELMQVAATIQNSEATLIIITFSWTAAGEPNIVLQQRIGEDADIDQFSATHFWMADWLIFTSSVRRKLCDYPILMSV